MRSREPVELVTPDFYLPKLSSNASKLSSNDSVDGLRQKTNSAITQTSQENLYLLILLIIPTVIILVLIFVCGIGRSCQVFFYKTCECILCPCFRPSENPALSRKLFDMTICYSDNDEHWLNEQFMTQLSEFDRGYKIHKLSLHGHSCMGPTLSDEQKQILCKSKRIVMMFSEKFTKNEWSDKQFREFMKKIYSMDNCVLVAINLGSMTDDKIKTMFKELTTRNIKTNDINQIYAYKTRQ